MKKGIEGKVRLQTQELPNQKHAAKAFVHPSVLLESGLQTGKLCSIESATANSASKRREAIVWPSPDKNAGRNVFLLSRAMQKAGGYELGETIRVTAAGDVPDAESVVIRDVSADLPPVREEDRKFWSWIVEGRLDVAEYIFPGLVLGDVVGKGPKRSFTVESVNGFQDIVAKSCASTKAQWFNEDEDAAADAKSLQGKLEVTGVPGMRAPLEDLNFFFGDFGVQFSSKARPSPSCGIVIQGSRGTGKTMLLDRIANTRWGQVTRIRWTDKPSTIQEHFKRSLEQEKPCILIIDDIKELVGKDRPNRQGAIEAIYNGLEDLATLTEQKMKRPNIVVVAACQNYLDDIPVALRTRRTFKRHVTLPIPDASARREILRHMVPNFAAEDLDQYIADLSDRTHAYTGRDLEEMLDNATDASRRRTGDRSGNQGLIWADLQRALQEVRPTAMHDITLKPPTVHWAHIGGYEEVKSTLQRVLKRPGAQGVKYKPPKGVLLYGPPGCSKTMTAQAMATESGFNFFAVKGGELLNMYVGETERSIRNLFQRAREASPSIIFFDEIDSIAGSRSPGGGGSTSGGGVQALTTLLTEMDGFEQMGNVFVLAATNKPDSLDPALLRPGRFDELIYVPLPDLKAREAILSRKAAELEFPENVDVPELASRTEGYSGAEIARICDRAFMDVEESANGMEVMEAAVKAAPMGVTREMLAHFDLWRRLRSNMG